ncbi:MAG: hypothetical protein R3F59_09490 [Myxococcota bacterium]
MMRWPRVAGFLLVGLVFQAVLYLGYVRLVAPGHKAIRADAAFHETAPQDIELLVCGDSHPRSDIDPTMLSDRTVNVAIGGEHYLKTWYRMRALLADGQHQVRALLLPLDAASFSSWHAENFAPEYVWGRYVDFLEVGRVRGTPFAYVGRALKAHVFPFAGELRTLNQIRTKRFGFGEELPLGSFGSLTPAQRRATALEQAKEHFRDADVMDPGLRWAFDQLVAWADARDIPVVLVAFPLTRWYDQWVVRSGARERVEREVVAPLLADPNHYYIDHHDIFGRRDELFADPHHLNALGRTLYSRHLREVLAERGVLRTAP